MRWTAEKKNACVASPAGDELAAMAKPSLGSKAIERQDGTLPDRGMRENRGIGATTGTSRQSDNIHHARRPCSPVQERDGR